MADITLTAAQIGIVNPREADVFLATAVEAITAGQPVYRTTAGKVGVADANGAGKQQARGIALNAAAAGETVSVLREGDLYGFVLSGLAYDAPVYLSDTAGSLADGQGTMKVIVGFVSNLNDAPDFTKVLHVNCDAPIVWA